MRLHAPWFKHTHAYQSSDTLLLLFLTESKWAWLTDSCCLLASCGTSVNTVLWGQSDPVWFKQSRNLTSHDSYLHTVASFLFRWSVLVNAGCKGVKNVSHSHCKTHTHTYLWCESFYEGLQWCSATSLTDAPTVKALIVKQSSNRVSQQHVKAVAVWRGWEGSCS